MRVSLLGGWLLIAAACGETNAPPPSVTSDASTDARVPDLGADSSAPRDLGPPCTRDFDCQDEHFCNGSERCDPASSSADARGCLPALDSTPCEAPQACNEAMDACASACATASDVDGDGRQAIACGGNDCDDNDRNRYPGNQEICDTSDHDEDCDTLTYGYRDTDMDGAGDHRCCNEEPSGTQHCGLDCNDDFGSVKPGAVDTCNMIDDDCDSRVDEAPAERFYPDVDGDGYGNRASHGVLACAAPADHVADHTDCDDQVRLTNPAAGETCDNVDNNCDGFVDEAGMRTLYRDLDGDGFGDGAMGMTMQGCAIPTGYVLTASDCDDEVATTHPDADELCNRVDDDCSFVGSAAGGVDVTEDMDNDMHSPPGGMCEGGFPKDDCAEDNADGYIGAPEICNAKDDDCDGMIDGPAATAWCKARLSDHAICVTAIPACRNNGPV